MNEKGEIELEVNLEHLDFWRYYIYSYFNFNTVLFICFNFALFGFALLVFLGNSFTGSRIIGLLISSFLFSILSILFSIYMSAEIAVDFETTFKYKFSDKKIEIIGKDSFSEFKWSCFTTVKEKKNHFFLSLKDGQITMIPKKDFTNKEDILEFRELLRTKLEDKALLKKSVGKLGLK